MATNKSQVKCYKPSNLCVWVSMSLSHSKTDQNSRKNQVSDLHQWSNLRLPSISRHNSNEPRLSHQGTSCFLQKFALLESIAHVCCMYFFLFSFFGCMMVRCVALILLLVAKGGCLQKSDLLLCLYKAKFVMQDSETEGRAFVVP
jgi:hypothetical protein